ncbi:MAG: hypothetical protein A2Y25_09395 [Candidatus Melainabacteria bacterium GWF2_37_15]|nr:MAG: hypothetical protein A2Y25_09395 [Candidatus Melainabacteria bacterium GWF2_37_15]
MITKSEEKYIYKPAVRKSDAIPLWFCFPSTYMIGMASLGYLHLFRLFDENPDVYPERVFTDTEKTFHQVENIELMGFSFSFELDFLGMFKIFDKYKIPFRAEDRGEEFPLVFGGGPVLTANPEPYAEFFDFINIGEGDESLVEVVNVYKEMRDIKDKKAKLERISQIPGIYVPSLNKGEKVVHKTYVKDFQKSLYTPILTEKSVFPNMFMVEIARGCPKKCHFCIASYLTLPARYPAFENIKAAIDTGLQYSDKIGLLGALITEHPDFDKICQYILEKRKEKEFEISVSSLRVDKITPLIIKTLVECGQKSSTVAIEAGTDRLRKKINKDLIETAIFKGIKTAHENGLTGLKVYGIIGLPGETQEDIEALADLMIRLKKDNKGFNLSLSVSSFVAKAQTPFQREARSANEELEAKSNYLRKELQTHKVQYKPTSIKWDYIQAVLSRGDRRLAPMLEKVYELSGTLGSWNRAFKEFRHLDPDWYALRARPQDEVLPWGFIQV